MQIKKISVDGKNVDATDIGLGNDLFANNLLDSVVRAVSDPSRKEDDRATDTLRVLAEVYEKFGLKKPEAILKVKSGTD